MKITIDAAAKNLRNKSHFNSNSFAKKLIAAESKTPAAKTLFKDNLAFKPATKETCVICLDDDIDSDLMFLVGNCGHRFCLNCVKHHIQVKLLDGTIPNCLEHQCKSQLCIDTCVNLLLNPKLVLMWKQRIKEDSIPFNERVYCPYQSCSYLMSRTEFDSFPGYVHRRCFKCSGIFCVNCKVPWHDSLSCNDYQRLYTIPQNDDLILKSLASINGWRQCHKCKHMVERSSGCNHITCRCGNGFCYRCGSKWNGSIGPICCITRYDHDEPIVNRGNIDGLIVLMWFCLTILGILSCILITKTF